MRYSAERNRVMWLMGREHCVAQLLRLPSLFVRTAPGRTRPGARPRSDTLSREMSLRMGYRHDHRANAPYMSTRRVGEIARAAYYVQNPIRAVAAGVSRAGLTIMGEMMFAPEIFVF